MLLREMLLLLLVVVVVVRRQGIVRNGDFAMNRSGLDWVDVVVLLLRWSSIVACWWWIHSLCWTWGGRNTYTDVTCFVFQLHCVRCVYILKFAIYYFLELKCIFTLKYIPF